MIALTLQEIAALTGGTLHPDDPATAAVVVDGPVVTSSREVARGGLFVARVGETTDGHRFVGAARAAGAVAALTGHVVEELPCVVVDDVQTAFGRIARGVLARATGLQTVAITGSSGKTSTKDLLAQVLATAGPTVAPVDSLNGEIGVPLTVCRITPDTRFLVTEMGARGIGHLAYLTTIAPPDVAIVLNVGTAHVGEFGSRANIALAKGELVEALAPGGLAVLNADDPAVAAMASRTSARVVTVGVDRSADVRATGVLLDSLGRASFTLNGFGRTLPVGLTVSGAHQVGNALAVVAAAVGCGLAPEDAIRALAGAGAVSRWRMEVHERDDGVTVVNDAYNANPDSMRAALLALRSIADAATPARRTWAVLGTMLELGAESVTAHRDVGRLTADLRVDRVVAVGDGARDIAVAADPAAVTWVPDADAAYGLLAEELADGDVVLLKSSRDAGLRWLGDRLVGLEVPL